MHFIQHNNISHDYMLCHFHCKKVDINFGSLRREIFCQHCRAHKKLTLLSTPGVTMEVGPGEIR